MKRKYILLILLISLSTFTFAQKTYVPDIAFETALINLGYDDIVDDSVLTSNIVHVTSLNVVSGFITDLTGIEAFLSLDSLLCWDNQLTSLDVSQNTALTVLVCGFNQITSLDLSKNTLLEDLACRSNKLSSLDLSMHTALKYLDCGINELSSLKLDNGNNKYVSDFYAIDNPNLGCIQVDDEAWSTTYWTNIDAIAFFSEDCNGSKTYIPDIAFEQTLINLGLDDFLDDSVLTSNIVDVTGLYIMNRSISDLTGIEAFLSLDSLLCGDNQLTSLNVSQNTALTVLVCGFNQITSLDLSQNILLTDLECSYNQLSSLDVTVNTALAYLDCSSNQLSSLDVTVNTALASLSCNSNQLTSLNVKNGNNINFTHFDASGNPNLGCIQVDDATWSTANWTLKNAGTSYNEDCYGPKTYVPDDNFEQALIDLGYDNVLNDSVFTADINAITTLNINAIQVSGFSYSRIINDLTGIEDFIALEELHCSHNALTNLDLSGNAALIDLYCDYNKLQSLNLTNNPALTNLICHDNQIPNLDLSKNIALIKLESSYNKLTSLDVSNNVNLISLSCSYNLLTSLNVKNGNNTNFTTFYATINQNLTCIQVDNAAWSTTNWTNKDATTSYNEDCAYPPLTYVPDDHFEQALIDLGYDSGSLDDYVQTATIKTITSLYIDYKNILDLTGIQDFTALDTLSCIGNQLTSIDLSANTSLTHLNCNWNQLTTLDVSKNTALTRLMCRQNELPSLNLTNNLALIFLNCEYNQLASLDVSLNTVLEELYLRANLISDLDLSNNIALIRLFAYELPYLTSLNIKNGNNLNFTYFDARNNSNLTCIQVDDTAWATTNWTTGIDATASFSENCGNTPTAITNIPDNNFEQALIDLGYDTAPPDGSIPTAVMASITTLDLSNKNISDLTGIEAFTALVNLNCSSNQLSSLNLSALALLEVLDCSNNQLVNLDLSNNLLLTSINCAGNQLTSLILISPSPLKATNSTLLTLNVSNNNLTSLDVSNYTALISLDCSSNQLTSLDVKNGNNSNFTFFDARSNPNLICIQVDDATWSTANWTNIDATSSFSDDCTINPNDTDGDGVDDIDDDFPNDPDRAFLNYFPASGYGCLGFEDLWPSQGDYDFNDLVLDYRFASITNCQNKVVEVIGTFVLKASGASSHNGFGFNLPDADPSLVNNLAIAGSDLRNNYISLNANGTEAGQSKPTVIVFDDFFNLMPQKSSGTGVNTNLTASFSSYDTLRISMVPNSLNYTSLDLSVETWNPFLIANGERGKEIHLIDHPPTDLANLSYFGEFDDFSSFGFKKYYRTKRGLPWAINITEEYFWPLEAVEINWAFIHFIEWAQSSGTKYQDWYKDLPGYRDKSKIYNPFNR